MICVAAASGGRLPLVQRADEAEQGKMPDSTPTPSSALALVCAAPSSKAGELSACAPALACPSSLPPFADSCSAAAALKQ